jgi:DNA-directed RNA polymerase subunit F
LKVLMAGEPLSLKQEDIKKIVDVVKKFVWKFERKCWKEM